MFLKRKWLTILISVTALILLFLSSAIALVYFQQDKIVNAVVKDLNHDFSGRIEIEDSHISPFVNFPYISIDLEDIKIFESKADSAELLLHLQDTYIGLDFNSLIQGNFVAKKITFEDGFIKLVQHRDGTFNLANALSDQEEENSTTAENTSQLDLTAVTFKNIDILKLNEENNVLLEAFIEEAETRLRKTDDFIDIDLKTRFLFNLIIESDTSFLHDKHVQIETGIHYNTVQNLLTIDSSSVRIENALFLMQGIIDVEDNLNLDLKFSGTKPNFDLFLAFAPVELQPLLGRYRNGGQIYFDASIKGPSINGYNPAINIDFGCKEAFIENTTVDKTVEDLYFEGHFTNGSKRNASTMELVISDFRAKPETGLFKGNVVVRNFDSPEFDIQLISDFDLNFLAKFLNIRNLEDVTGFVSLEMNFHDIIDLSKPEKSIEKLNESYFTKLKVANLNLKSTKYELPLENMNISAQMDGHVAEVDNFSFNIGKSNIKMKASISDLPAILHHTDIPVTGILDISSEMIDLNELSKLAMDSTKMKLNEQIKDLSLRLKLNSSARAFTESPTLPVGEFFVEKLHANLTNYPHELHDFNADIMIDSSNFQIIDFTGMIDQSDFHFNGKLTNYDLWFQEDLLGTTTIDFNFNSNLLQLDDLFTYGGENYVPEDYRHEEFKNLKLHGITSLNFNKQLESAELVIDELSADLKIHPMRFEQFEGNFLYNKETLEVREFKGKLGNSDFSANMKYYLTNDSITPPHSLYLQSTHLDFDQLFAYNAPPGNQEESTKKHKEAFNIFELPFTNMDFKLDLQSLRYHRYQLDNFFVAGQMQENHYIYLDTMYLQTAGGQIGLSAYFDGKDPSNIYFRPNLKLENIDLDQLLFKFENFGQDHLVSENLHGKLSGGMTGKIHVYPDLIPIIDDSQIHMDLKVTDGSLNNYSALEALSDYFADKNLAMVRFDTLKNSLDIKNGHLIIPKMAINSTLGYIEISGEQDMGKDLDMEYYISVPLKVVTKAGFSKLFKGDKSADTQKNDSIYSKSEYENSKFVNLKISGNPDTYKITLGKKE